MKLAPYLPDTPSVVRECIVVIAGAILAAAVMGACPQLKAWIKEQWQ